MAAGQIVSLAELLETLKASNQVNDLINDPAAQFGTGDTPYLGALYLPEQLRDENMYKEEDIKFRSFVANAGSYYSPAQLNPGGQLIGSFNVELGKTDQADQVTAQDYKTLMKLLNRKQTREAILNALAWFDNHILRPLLDLNEKYRWDAFIDASVLRTGSNAYTEVVNYPNPAGHRPAPISGGTLANPAGWYEVDGSYDPFEDIFAMADMFSRKGYRLSRIITGGRKLISVLGKNPVVRERTSRITVSNSGQIEAQPGRATAAQMNAFLNEEGIPNFEIYDKTYHTRQLGEQLYVPDDTIVLLCTTGRTQNVDLGERGVLTLDNTMGYYGMGTTAQAFLPGRTFNVEERNLYPGGYYSEGIQVGLPVIQDPEAIGVLKISAPVAV